MATKSNPAPPGVGVAKPIPPLAVPFTNGITDVSGLMEVDGVLVGAMTRQQYIVDRSRFLWPQEVDILQRWVTAHPTADPRAWMPVAQMGIEPDSEAGVKVATGSIQQQVLDGTYGGMVGAPTKPIPNSSYVSPHKYGLFEQVLSGIGTAADAGYNALKGATRTSLTLLSAPYEAVIASMREAGGNQADMARIADKWDLSDDERTVAMSGLDFSSADRFTADQKSRMKAARDEFFAQRPTFGEAAGSVALQTQLGQVAKNPSLLVAKPVQTTDAVGNTVTTVEQERSWMPSSVGQAKAAEQAAKTWDLRTADQVARGAAPVPWTIGRGTASKWWDPDTTAFNAISGVIDFGSNLAADPVNLIPMGALGKVIKAPARLTRSGRLTARAFETGGEKVVAAVPTMRLTGESNIPSAFHMARPGARGAEVANPILAGTVGKTVLDPSLEARGYVIDDAGRALNSAGKPIPAGKIVVSKASWDWLNSGRGARVVDALVEETSPSAIVLRSNGNIDLALASQLAYADSAAAVRSALATRLGYDIANPSDLGNLGGRGPALFRRVLHTDVSGKELDSGGIFTQRGRAALKSNYERAGVAGSVRGMYRRPFRLAPTTQGELDGDNPNQVFAEAVRFMQGARVPLKDFQSQLDTLVRSHNGAAVYDALFDENTGLLSAVLRRSLVEHGLQESDAHAITRVFQGGLDAEMRDSLNSHLAGDVGGATNDGRAIGKPLVTSDMLSRNIPMPNYRTVARASSVLGKIRKAGGANVEDQIADAIHGLTSEWRNLVLMRPAYVLREVGEMAFAMSLSGYDAALTHPLGSIALAMNTALAKESASMSGRLTKALLTGDQNVKHMEYLKTGDPTLAKTRIAAYKAAGVPGKLLEHTHMSEGLDHLYPRFGSGMARINGDSFWGAYNRFLDTGDEAVLGDLFDNLSSINGSFLMDERAARAAARHMRTVLRDETGDREDYVAAFINKIRVASGDFDMRNLANPEMDQADVLSHFRDYTRSIKKVMRKDLLDDAKPELDVEYLQKQRNVLQQLTLGNEDLLDAVLHRSYDGQPLTKANVALRKRIEGLLEDEATRQQMPSTMAVMRMDSAAKAKYQKMVQAFFENTGEFSDIFVRGPLIRQAYAKRVKELAPDLSPAAKAQVVKNLRDAGDHSLAREIAAIPVSRDGTLGIEEVDAIASGFARKESQRIFYNAYRRQNYAVAMRTVMPFAQATFNTFRRWGELSMRNPQYMYRTTKPIEALTDPGSAALYQLLGAATGDETMQSFYTPGHPEASVDGFFFTDSYGDRKFAYPLVGTLAGLLPGVNMPKGIPFLGSAAGLNVAGYSINPGFGPAITLPATWFIGSQINENNWKGQVERFLFPFGLPQGSLPDKIWGGITPTALSKLAKSTSEDAVANNAVRMIPLLIATGDYDMGDPGSQQRLQSDAARLGKQMSTFAAIFGAVTPSTFNPSSVITLNGDKTGGQRMYLLQDRLYQEFKKYTANDYNQGLMQFVQDYGTTALFAVMPQTKIEGDSIGVASSTSVWDFRTDHPESYSQHRSVVGLFFPGGDAAGDFANNLYRWQKTTGERNPKTPEEFVHDVDNALGWMLYEQQNKEILKSTDDPNQISDLRGQARRELQQQFPGFSGKASDLGAFDVRMQEIRSALKDPGFKALPSYRAINAYYQAREQAIDHLVERTGSTNLTTNEAAPERDALLKVATQMVRTDTSGGFANAWTRLFSSEFPEEG